MDAGDRRQFTVVHLLLSVVCCAVVVGWSLALSPVPAQEERQSPGSSVEERQLAAMHSISSQVIFDYVKEMSSEKFRGRLTGTPEYNAAAKWASDLLAGWKIRPAGDSGTYLQHFPNPYTLVLPGAELNLDIPVANQGAIRKSYLFEQDFFPGSTSDSGSVTAEVVYAGYGITAPELGYDDYQGVDVRGRIVLIEPEVPVAPDKDADLFKSWRPYSFHDYKALNAKKHGAAGILYNYLIVNPNCVFVKDLLLTYVGRSVVDDLFAGTGKKHDAVLSNIRSGRKPASFGTDKTVTMKNVTENHPEGIGINVLSFLDGADPALRQETVVIGAHLDHVGMNDSLMPGANDNASGAAVLLGAAEALARCGIPMKRSVLFILFGAEEQGVKGSEYYVAHPIVPNDRIKGFINLESVGRGEILVAGAGKNYPALFSALDHSNHKYVHRQLVATFAANLARPRQDAAHFMWANVPTISFGTSGARPLPYAAYHTTRDRPEILNPEIMRDLARLVYLSALDIANNN
jgi:hypothetical protein